MPHRNDNERRDPKNAVAVTPLCVWIPAGAVPTEPVRHRAYAELAAFTQRSGEPAANATSAVLGTPAPETPARGADLRACSPHRVTGCGTRRTPPAWAAA